MNNLLYCGLIDVRINASDKDLPVRIPLDFLDNILIKMASVNSARFSNFGVVDVTNGSYLLKSFLELHHNSFYNCVFTRYIFRKKMFTVVVSVLI